MVGVILAALPGCKGQSADEDGSGNSGDLGTYCARAITKLNGCGMGALFTGQCSEPDSAEIRCADDCILGATCEELRALVCTGSTSSALTQCITGCEPPPFICGSGESLSPDSKCDGYDDCADGSDERAGCPTCANGQTLPEYRKCDGFPDCADGADESGCPTFRCSNGETVPESSECDFYRNCADGSDEHARCPGVFTCANGELIPDIFECDSYPDCSDGTDEHARCPTVTCADGTTTAGVRCDGNADCFDASDEPTSCPPTPQEEICGTR